MFFLPVKCWMLCLSTVRVQWILYMSSFKGTVAWDGFLAIPYGIVRKNLKQILICIIIFIDIHTFTSLGLFGEYAKSLSASSPLTHKSFPRILWIRLNTFCAYGDDFYNANNPDLTQSPSTLKYFPRILHRCLNTILIQKKKFLDSY
jgi:hypothetical protein